MDRRLALALLLSGLAVVVSSMLFPPAPRRSVPPATAIAESTQASATPLTPVPARQELPATPPSPETLPADTLTVETQRAVYQFSTLGAAPVGVLLREYRALNRDSGSVQLVRDSVPLVAFGLVSSTDTVRLDQTL